MLEVCLYMGDSGFFDEFTVAICRADNDKVGLANLSKSYLRVLGLATPYSPVAMDILRTAADYGIMDRLWIIFDDDIWQAMSDLECRAWRGMMHVGATDYDVGGSPRPTGSVVCSRHIPLAALPSDVSTGSYGSIHDVGGSPRPTGSAVCSRHIPLAVLPHAAPKWQKNLRQSGTP